MKRAALYIRVSTLDQHPETQLHELRQFADFATLNWPLSMV
jgi:DNA invertase Pin-like site-specific DNA recombinase